ncbi:MAG: hypothetical protein HKM03_09920 [Steroidobacteraceae bacterium]|nr:hypothetical protein [Steroidobacteraceae bacterium]
MIWLLFVGLQVFILISGIRQQEHAGTWSWSLFAFAVGFMAFELLILLLPLRLGMEGSRYFAPVWTAAWIFAALNFIWFIAVCRRRKPGRRGG